MLRTAWKKVFRRRGNTCVGKNYICGSKWSTNVICVATSINYCINTRDCSQFCCYTLIWPRIAQKPKMIKTLLFISLATLAQMMTIEEAKRLARIKYAERRAILKYECVTYWYFEVKVDLHTLLLLHYCAFWGRICICIISIFCHKDYISVKS